MLIRRLFILLLLISISSGMATAGEVSPFTGLALNDGELPRPVVAIVDNYSAAKPQAGLEKASIVYEFPVEGGITRLLAIYYDALPARIGPIRSARSYMVDKTREYDGILLHAGASPSGNERIKALHILSLDQFNYSPAYWRSEDRSPPYNLYTGWPYLKPYIEEIQPNSFSSRFPFLDITIVDTTTIDYLRVEVFFSQDNRVEYKYLERYGNYQRYVNGQPHLMDNDEPIKVDNLVLQFVQAREIDELGRLEMSITGSGPMLLFRDGQLIEGTWLKAGPGWTSFLDSRGRLIRFNVGTTWIEVVPEARKVVY